MSCSIAALDYEPQPSAEAPVEVFNLGNGHPIKLPELVGLLEQATGRRAIYDYRPAQPEDVPLTLADIGKAKRFLGYQPSTPIEEGLKRFLISYREAARTQGGQPSCVGPAGGAR